MKTLILKPLIDLKCFALEVVRMRLFSVAIATTMASPATPKVAHFFEHRGRAFPLHAEERVILNLLLSALQCRNSLSLYVAHTFAPPTSQQPDKDINAYSSLPYDGSQRTKVQFFVVRINHLTKRLITTRIMWLPSCPLK